LSITAELKMAELTISIPPEPKTQGPYTPIDELNPEAMSEIYIEYEENKYIGPNIDDYEKVIVGKSVNDATQIIIDYINHRNESRFLGLNRAVYIHPMISFLSKHNKLLLKELKSIVDSLNPNPCEEFMKNLKRKEQEKKEKEELREKKRKDIMGPEYQEYFILINSQRSIFNKISDIRNLIQMTESSINRKRYMIKGSDKKQKHGVNVEKQENLIKLDYKKIEELSSQKSEFEKEFNENEPKRIELKKEYDSIY
jgi:hypothetical protein